MKFSFDSKFLNAILTHAEREKENRRWTLDLGRVWEARADYCWWLLDDNHLTPGWDLHLDISDEHSHHLTNLPQRCLQRVHGENPGDRHLHGASPPPTGDHCCSEKKTIFSAMDADIGLLCHSILTLYQQQEAVPHLPPSAQTSRPWLKQ